MGLDVYVGTFTRYYQRDWLTIVQQLLPEVRIYRADDGQPKASPEEIREAVAAWAAGLAQSLGVPSLGSEDAGKPYFSDKPAWDGYGGLLLWAAYDDQEIRPASRRDPIRTDNWEDDPALRRYADPRVETRYPQILLGQEIWLPISGPTVFRSVDAGGTERMFGNCAKLLAELELLNRRTWSADAATEEEWRRDGCEHGSPLEAAARAGWAKMHGLVREAVRHGLPVILDY